MQNECLISELPISARWWRATATATASRLQNEANSIAVCVFLALFFIQFFKLYIKIMAFSFVSHCGNEKLNVVYLYERARTHPGAHIYKNNTSKITCSWEVSIEMCVACVLCRRDAVAIAIAAARRCYYVQLDMFCVLRLHTYVPIHIAFAATGNLFLLLRMKN